MAKDALVNDNLAAKFATEKDSPYTRWVAAEGLDIIAAHYVPDLRTVELKPWARRGGRGVFINHEATRTSNDCYVCEIPAGGTLAPQRQLFEEMILVLDGHGSTKVSTATSRWRWALLRDELAVTSALLVVDGLSLRDFDYIDIGRVRYPSGTVPVTIKSLVFGEEPAAGG